MSSTAERMKAALLAADSELRMAALYYFASESSPDPSLMPLVMQACERFGDDAFETIGLFEDLVQTDESVAWLCRKIDEAEPGADEASSDRFVGLMAALRSATPALLERHATTIWNLRHLDDDFKTVIANRIQLASLTPDDLWQRLSEFCQDEDQKGEADKADVEGYDFACDIVDALATHPPQSADQVIEILRGEAGEVCLELMAAQLAGALRLEAATTLLIDRLVELDSPVAAVARWSLAKIGTDSVVKELAVRYAADEDLRPEIASLFENLHTDLSVQTCLDLLGQEQDDEVREHLILSTLMNFSVEAIEPARQFVLTHEKNPEVLEIRHALLLACKLLEARFPELDAWLEDSNTDTEFLSAWYQEHGYTEFPEDFDDLGDFDPGDLDLDAGDENAWQGDDSDDGLESGIDDQPAETIVRHDEKVGRNDPCPCGSGKKYKKCCLHKQALG